MCTEKNLPVNWNSPCLNCAEISANPNSLSNTTETNNKKTNLNPYRCKNKRLGSFSNMISKQVGSKRPSWRKWNDTMPPIVFEQHYKFNTFNFINAPTFIMVVKSGCFASTLDVVPELNNQGFKNEVINFIILVDWDLSLMNKFPSSICNIRQNRNTGDISPPPTARCFIW